MQTKTHTHTHNIKVSVVGSRIANIYTVCGKHWALSLALKTKEIAKQRNHLMTNFKVRRAGEIAE